MFRCHQSRTNGKYIKQKKLQNLGLADGRVDLYWQEFFKLKSINQDDKKLVVKRVLCLQNGTADMEKSLSENKNTFTTERTNLLPGPVIGLRQLKD